jgi:hypothetical protein
LITYSVISTPRQSVDPAATFIDSRDSFQADFAAGGNGFVETGGLRRHRASSAASPALAPTGRHMKPGNRTSTGDSLWPGDRPSRVLAASQFDLAG